MRPRKLLTGPHSYRATHIFTDCDSMVRGTAQFSLFHQDRQRTFPYGAASIWAIAVGVIQWLIEPDPVDCVEPKRTLLLPGKPIVPRTGERRDRIRRGCDGAGCASRPMKGLCDADAISRENLLCMGIRQFSNNHL